MSQFPAIRIEGGLLGPDTLEQLLAGELPGQKPKDFGLDGRHNLTEEIASALADARTQWEVFQRRLARLPEDDPATSVTRDAWVIPFLSLLGYELRYSPRAHEIDGATFAISHRAGEADDAPPVHIVGARQELGRAAPTGRPRLAPHSLVQEYLNRTDHLWALVTNGLVLRLLRDCTFVRRQAYVEFDLRQILEEQRFGDFAVLYRLLHRTRLPRTAADAPNCLLEQYHRQAVEQGGRVRERLRDGVEACIKRLANGFLAHPANAGLRGEEASSEWRVASGEEASSEPRVASGSEASSEPRVASGSEASSEQRVASSDQPLTTRHSPLAPEPLATRHSPLAPEPLATRHSPLAPEPLATRHSPLAPEPLATRHSPLADSAAHDFYRQLLRLVYRLLFLLVSEDRGLISGETIYREHYGVTRLRRLLDRHSAYTEHEDIWCSLKVLWKVLSDEQLAACLGASPLNGALFEPFDLDQYSISNRDFLEAFWHLAYYREDASAPPRRVNYAALDVEELGSVYESLLDYHPQIDTSGSVPRFELAFGSERKSTGSYYTPPELVAELIRSALEPVLEERLAEARQMADELQRVAGSEWRVVRQMITERFGEGHGNSILSRLGSLAESDAPGRTGVSAHRELPARGTVRVDKPDATGSNLGSGEHCGGMGPAGNEGVSSFSQHRGGQLEGAGNLPSAGTASGTGDSGDNPADAGLDSRTQQTDGESSAQPQEGLVPHSPTASTGSSGNCPYHSPLATHHSLPTPHHSPLARSLAEHALLSLRVLDPACGSGHFLLAAARRLGKELAKIRTGEDEPAPERVREAIRDVVAHCLYGVDKNPLAVELCRVVLWLEAHCMGKPLTFLDHRIKCGDSLIGVLDLNVLEAGLPDDAFTPVSADDKTAAGSLKKRNKKERRDLETGQGQLPFDPTDLLTGLREQRQQLEAIADDSPDAVRRKKTLYDRYCRDPQHRKLAEACNLWTAAFFQHLTPETAKSAAAITTQVITDHLADRKHPQAVAMAEALAAQHRFFHWPLEFPEVASSEWRVASGNEASSEQRVASGDEASSESRVASGDEASSESRVASGDEASSESRVASGELLLATRHSPLAHSATRHSPLAHSATRHSPPASFDVVLGNPPWERIKLQEEEFFASRDPDIAQAPNAAARKRLIAQLSKTNPSLWDDYQRALHGAESTSRFLRGSGQYPLTGRGDINTYSVFAERIRHLLDAHGRAGFIVPTGIATDATNQFFFADLVQKGQLASLFDFENREAIFPAVHRSYKFCLLTLTGESASSEQRVVSSEQRVVSSEQRVVSSEQRVVSSEQRVASGELLLATRHSPLAHSATRHSLLAFFATRAEHLRDPRRVFSLTADDIARINPNTGTLPVFRTRQDADLTRAIYGRVPVLVNGQTGENPWGVRFMAMFHMSNDSHLFRTRAELEKEGYRLVGNVFVKEASSEQRVASGEQRVASGEQRVASGDEASSEPRVASGDEASSESRVASGELLLATRHSPLAHSATRHSPLAHSATRHSPLANSATRHSPLAYLPLYEAKMIWHYDHRYGTYQGVRDRSGTQLPRPDERQHADPQFVAQPWYWVPAEEVAARLGDWKRGWLMGWRDIVRSTDERTVVPAVVPLTAYGDKFLLLLPQTDAITVAALMGCLASIPFDYVSRQKVGGVSLKFFTMKQLPVLPPTAYTPEDLQFIVPRVLELTCTAWDMQPFADDVWNEADEELRAVIRAQWEANQGASSEQRVASSESRVASGELLLATRHSPLANSATRHSPLAPFIWDETRRAVLRAELDAYYARLYGLTRKQLRYILDPADLTERELEDILDPWEDGRGGWPTAPTANTTHTFPGETFRVLKEKELRQFGEYRTRRLVLEAWHRLSGEGNV